MTIRVALSGSWLKARACMVAVLCIAAILVFSSCALVPGLTSTPPVTSVGPGSVEPPQVVATSTTRSTVAPIAGWPERTPTKRCSHNGTMSLVDLVHDDKLLLTLRAVNDEEPTGAYVMGRLDPVPRRIPNADHPAGWQVHSLIPSPSGTRLLVEYVDPSGLELEVWTTAPSGARAYRLATVRVGTRVSWVSDHELVAVGLPEAYPSEDSGLDDYLPLFTLDTETGSRTELGPLPPQAAFRFFFVESGKNYAIYSDLLDRQAYYLYDYSREQSAPAFQWLWEVPGDHNLLPGLGVAADGYLYAAVDRPYGLDLALGLSLGQTLQEETYQEIMRTLELPEASANGLSWFAYPEATDGPRIPLMAFDPGAVSDPGMLLVLNSTDLGLTDYCLRDVLAGRLAVPSGRMYASPDARLLALDLEEIVDPSLGTYGPWGTLVLDLETGQNMLLQGFAPAGWVVVGD